MNSAVATLRSGAQRASATSVRTQAVVISDAPVSPSCARRRHGPHPVGSIAQDSKKRTSSSLRRPVLRGRARRAQALSQVRRRCSAHIRRRSTTNSDAGPEVPGYVAPGRAGPFRKQQRQLAGGHEPHRSADRACPEVVVVVMVHLRFTETHLPVAARHRAWRVRVETGGCPERPGRRVHSGSSWPPLRRAIGPACRSAEHDRFRDPSCVRVIEHHDNAGVL